MLSVSLLTCKCLHEVNMSDEHFGHVKPFKIKSTHIQNVQGHCTLEAPSSYKNSASWVRWQKIHIFKTDHIFLFSALRSHLSFSKMLNFKKACPTLPQVYDVHFSYHYWHFSICLQHLGHKTLHFVMTYGGQCISTVSLRSFQIPIFHFLVTNDSKKPDHVTSCSRKMLLCHFTVSQYGFAGLWVL